VLAEPPENFQVDAHRVRFAKQRRDGWIEFGFWRRRWT
jgi:hypothetical protein